MRIPKIWFLYRRINRNPKIRGKPKNQKSGNKNQKIEKSATSTIEIVEEIWMFFYERVNRITSRDYDPIFDTDFAGLIRYHRFPSLLYGSGATFLKIGWSSGMAVPLVDCLNITSTALLGCSFMARQGLLLGGVPCDYLEICRLVLVRTRFTAFHWVSLRCTTKPNKDKQCWLLETLSAKLLVRFFPTNIFWAC